MGKRGRESESLMVMSRMELLHTIFGWTLRESKTNALVFRGKFKGERMKLPIFHR